MPRREIKTIQDKELENQAHLDSIRNMQKDQALDGRDASDISRIHKERSVSDLEKRLEKAELESKRDFDYKLPKFGKSKRRKR